MDPEAQVDSSMDEEASEDDSDPTEELDQAAADDLTQQAEILATLPASWGLTEHGSRAEAYDQLKKWTNEEVMVVEDLSANAGALFRRYNSEEITVNTLGWDCAVSLFKKWSQAVMPDFAVSASFGDHLFITRKDAEIVTFPKYTYHHGTCLLFAPSIAERGLMPAISRRRGSERENLQAAIWCNNKYSASKNWSQRVELGALLEQEYLGWFLSCSCCVADANLRECQQIDVFIVEFENMAQLDGRIIMPRVRGVFKPPPAL